MVENPDAEQLAGGCGGEQPSHGAQVAGSLCRRRPDELGRPQLAAAAQPETGRHRALFVYLKGASTLFAHFWCSVPPPPPLVSPERAEGGDASGETVVPALDSM